MPRDPILNRFDQPRIQRRGETQRRIQVGEKVLIDYGQLPVSSGSVNLGESIPELPPLDEADAQRKGVPHVWDTAVMGLDLVPGQFVGQIVKINDVATLVNVNGLLLDVAPGDWLTWNGFTWRLDRSVSENRDAIDQILNALVQYRATWTNSQTVERETAALPAVHTLVDISVGAVGDVYEADQVGTRFEFASTPGTGAITYIGTEPLQVTVTAILEIAFNVQRNGSDNDSSLVEFGIMLIRTPDGGGDDQLQFDTALGQGQSVGTLFLQQTITLQPDDTLRLQRSARVIEESPPGGTYTLEYTVAPASFDIISIVGGSGGVDPVDELPPTSERDAISMGLTTAWTGTDGDPLALPAGVVTGQALLFVSPATYTQPSGPPLVAVTGDSAAWSQAFGQWTLVPGGGSGGAALDAFFASDTQTSKPITANGTWQQVASVTIPAGTPAGSGYLLASTYEVQVANLVRQVRTSIDGTSIYARTLSQSWAGGAAPKPIHGEMTVTWTAPDALAHVVRFEMLIPSGDLGPASCERGTIQVARIGGPAGPPGVPGAPGGTLPPTSEIDAIVKGVPTVWTGTYGTTIQAGHFLGQLVQVLSGGGWFQPGGVTPITAGALDFLAWTGSAWLVLDIVSQADLDLFVASAMNKANNLSDVASIPASRTNLDVYSKAEVDALLGAGPGVLAKLGQLIPAQVEEFRGTLANINTIWGVAGGVTASVNNAIAFEAGGGPWIRLVAGASAGLFRDTAAAGSDAPRWPGFFNSCPWVVYRFRFFADLLSGPDFFWLGLGRVFGTTTINNRFIVYLSGSEFWVQASDGTTANQVGFTTHPTVLTNPLTLLIRVTSAGSMKAKLIDKAGVVYDHPGEVAYATWPPGTTRWSPFVRLGATNGVNLDRIDAWDSFSSCGAPAPF